MKSAPSRNNRISLEKAKKEDIKDIVDLIYIREPEPEEEWGYGSEKERKETLEKLMKMDNNRFSLDNILVAKKANQLIGMVLLIEGKEIDRLTINSEKEVVTKQKGLLNKLGFIYSSLKGWFFFEECKEDELYISNIAIKPEHRGHGYATIMIQKIYHIAQKKGYKKVSLVAKNDKLIQFYESIGFNLVNKKYRRMMTVI